MRRGAALVRARRHVRPESSDLLVQRQRAQVVAGPAPPDADQHPRRVPARVTPTFRAHTHRNTQTNTHTGRGETARGAQRFDPPHTRERVSTNQPPKSSVAAASLGVAGTRWESLGVAGGRDSGRRNSRVRHLVMPRSDEKRRGGRRRPPPTHVPGMSVRHASARNGPEPWRRCVATGRRC